MKIILIRHGQTIANKKNIIQGHSNTELSDFGRRQAITTSKRLEYMHLAAIYASDLRRASETAEIIAAPHKLTVIEDSRLRECSFGEWEGLSVDEVKDRYGVLYEAYRLDSVKNRAPGGEKLEQLQSRAAEAINEIAISHINDTIAVVTHGGPIKALFCYVLGAGLETFRRINVSNCSLTTIRYEEGRGWFLNCFNDACHLDGLDESDLNRAMRSFEYLT